VEIGSIFRDWTAQQLITHGLIDEIFVHAVPVLFGSGVRYFEHENGEHVPLEIIETIETNKIIHLRFRVIK